MDFLVFVGIYESYIIRRIHILSTSSSSSLNRDQNHSTVFFISEK